MAKKKPMAVIKLNIEAGKANPAPPVGTALGPHGVAIMDFCKAYNEATKDKMGEVIPVVISIYKDRTFSFELKTPPVSSMIKKTLGLEKGSAEPNKEKVGKLTMLQVEEIAKRKLQDMNARDLEAAKKMVMGTAKNMGVTIEK